MCGRRSSKWGAPQPRCALGREGLLGMQLMLSMLPVNEAEVGRPAVEVRACQGGLLGIAVDGSC